MADGGVAFEDVAVEARKVASRGWTAVGAGGSETLGKHIEEQRIDGVSVVGLAVGASKRAHAAREIAACRAHKARRCFQATFRPASRKDASSNSVVVRREEGAWLLYMGGAMAIRACPGAAALLASGNFCSLNAGWRPPRNAVIGDGGR